MVWKLKYQLLLLSFCTMNNLISSLLLQTTYTWNMHTIILSLQGATFFFNFSYVPCAPSTWMNFDTSAKTSLALRTMLISTCQSVLSSKLSPRPRSQLTTVLWTLQILTDFRCQCACAPVRWSHLGPFLLWYGGVRFFWFLCFGGF